MTALVMGGCSSESKIEISVPDGGRAGDGALSDIVSFYKNKYEIPAMAVITVQNNQTIEKASVGVRQIEHNISVLTDDHWAIGSVTKSMTATLVGVMIDQGVLNWDTTLAELFPEFDEMQERYHHITMIELLSHSAGLPEDDDSVWAPFVDSNRSLISQRYVLTKEALAYDSDERQGSYVYSNINYVIVAAILEKLTAKPFETLIEEYLFTPLGMQNSQVELTGLHDEIWGHKYQNGQYRSINPTIDHVDNAAIVAPAGSRTYVTLEDMGRYLQAHLQAKQGTATLMAIENFETLHSKVIDADEDLGYALGWFTEGTYGLQHSGSDDRWLSLSFINAETGFAYFVVVNAYKEGIEEAVFEMIKVLIKRTNTLLAS